MNLMTFLSYSSEAFLAFVILYQLCFYVYKTRVTNYNFASLDVELFWQINIIFLFMLFLYSINGYESFVFSNLLINDFGTQILKMFYIFVCFYVLNLIKVSFSIEKLWFLEFYTFFLISTLAALFILNSTDLILIFILVETFTMCFYILSIFKLDSFSSSRAGLKYILVGAYITGLFLFGTSLIYGFFGTVNLLNINILLDILNFDHFALLNTVNVYNNIWIRFFVFLGFFFVLIALVFKLNSSPFHFWSVDVYDDAPLSSTIIFANLPKLVFQLLMIRFTGIIMQLFEIYKPIFLLLGLLSITFGIFYALRQKRLKLLIIFSSVSQVGFLLFAISDCLTAIEGNSISLFFLVIYTLTSLLVWFFIVIENASLNNLSSHKNISHKKLTEAEIRYRTIENLVNTKFDLLTKSEQFFILNIQNSSTNLEQYQNNKQNIFYISNLKNSYYNSDLTVISYLIIFFSFASIPPLAGFISKFYVILQMFVNDNYLIGIYILVLSAFATYYYINIIKLAFFEYKSLKLKMSYNTLKIIISTPGIEFLYLINQFLLFLLIFIFFNPNIIYSICEYIILNII